MAATVPSSVIPVEADGWRVLQDPQHEFIYWRCRALVLESASWREDGHCNNDWLPLNPWHWAFTNMYRPTHTVERKAIWESLFLEP